MVYLHICCITVHQSRTQSYCTS